MYWGLWISMRNDSTEDGFERRAGEEDLGGLRGGRERAREGRGMADEWRFGGDGGRRPRT